MACGAERVQPSIIGGSVRLVEPRPRAHSPTHAAPSARGGPQSKHPQLTQGRVAWAVADPRVGVQRGWGRRRIGDILLRAVRLLKARNMSRFICCAVTCIRCASLLGSQMRALFWRELGADGDPA